MKYLMTRESPVLRGSRAFVLAAGAALSCAAPVGAATASAPVNVQIALDATRQPVSCTSSAESVNSSNILRLTCTQGEYLTLQPLASSEAFGFGDAYRLNFGPPVLASAQESQPASRSAAYLVPAASGGSGTLFFVPGASGGIPVAGGGVLAVRFENVGSVKDLLELLVSF